MTDHDTIQWQTATWQTETETVSSDRRWHITEKKDCAGGVKMHLANYDLICAPLGHGKDKAECFAKFIESCDKYAETLAKAKAAAEAQLATLTNREGTHDKG